MRISPVTACVMLLAVFAGCRADDRHAASQPAGRASLQRFEFSERKWGAAVRIVLYAPDASTAKNGSTAVFARFDELGQAFDDYNPQSEISQLSMRTQSGPMTQAVPVSSDLFAIFQASVQAADLSGGAFDITIGPFTKLWRRSRDMGLLPTPERLADARKSFGIQNLQLDPATRSVRLSAPKMKLDVDGLAAGYAIEESLKVLARYGIVNALVDGSGEVAARGAPPGEPGWRVAIETLESPNQMTGGFVLLRNNSVSTSGDTYRYVEIDGKRYSHIVDPRTGLGLTSQIGVTAVAGDGVTADWLSTAVSVLGVVKGLELVERLPGAAARITIIENGQTKVYESSRFSSMLATNRPSSGPVPANPVN